MQFSRCGPMPMRLDHLADGARLDQLARLHRGPVLVPLAVHDRIDALGLGLHPADLGQLLPAWSRPACRPGSPCPPAWPGCPAARARRGWRRWRSAGCVGLQDLLLAAGQLGLGVASWRRPRPGRAPWRRRRPARRRPRVTRLHLAVHVGVVHADHGEADARRARRRLGRGLGRLGLRRGGAFGAARGRRRLGAARGRRRPAGPGRRRPGRTRNLRRSERADDAGAWWPSVYPRPAAKA